MHPTPERYQFPPTPHVPNSVLPALIYRNVLGESPTEASVTEQIEKNSWMKGGVFKTYYSHHFHSVTHEVYAVIKGRSRLLIGRGPMDEDTSIGVEVDVDVGDVIVLPAGVAHCSVTSEGGYEYTGHYPKGSPTWDNNWCKAGPGETEEKGKTAKTVPIPEHDPIWGEDGPLVHIWKEAAATAASA